MLSYVLLRIKLKLFSDAVVQMGKDVVSFLTWAAEPEMEERKLVLAWKSCLHHMKSIENPYFVYDIVCLCFVVQMQMGFKWIFVLSLALLQAGYYRRMKWSILKSRKLVLDVVN